MDANSQDCFSDEDKERLLRDGYLIVRNAVSPELIAKARAVVSDALPENEHRLLVPAQLAGHEAVLGLLTQSCLQDLLTKEMGPFPNVIGQFLEYPNSYDPWATSVDKLCEPWSEWGGLQALVNSTLSGSSSGPHHNG